MAKDEELLLGLEKDSDSDDVVEEFKLPRKKQRRKRTKGGIPEARVATAGTSLVTWRCCFSFVLLSLLISGGLVLAYFIYNMHIQIYDLKRRFTINIHHSNTIFDAYKSKLKTMEGKHKDFSKFQTSHDTIVQKLKGDMEKIEKQQKDEKGDGLAHRVKTLEADVDALKNGMANSGSLLEKTQRYMVGIEDELKELKKKFNAIKLESMNPTTREREQGSDAGNSNYMTRAELNVILKKLIDGQVDESSASNKKILSELTNLKIMHRDLNVTHNSDLLRLTKSAVEIKKQFESHKQAYEPVVDELKNATTRLLREFDLHKNDVSLIEAKLQYFNETVRNMKVPTSATSTPDNKKTNPQQTTPAATTQEPTTTVATTHDSKTILTSAATTTTKLSTGANNSSKKVSQNTPVLPDESHIHNTPSPPSLTPERVKTPQRSAQSTPNPLEHHTSASTRVYEQTSKNETEVDYKQFKTVTGHDKDNRNASDGKITDKREEPQINIDVSSNNEDTKRPPPNPLNPYYPLPSNGDVGNTKNRDRRPYINTDDRNSGNEDSQYGKLSSRQNQNQYDPDEEEDTKALENMSDSEKRELIQNILKAKGNSYPYNDGD